METELPGFQEHSAGLVLLSLSNSGFMGKGLCVIVAYKEVECDPLFAGSSCYSKAVRRTKCAVKSSQKLNYNCKCS